MRNGFRVSSERLMKFHAWRVGGTRFGGYNESGAFQWNGNFEFQIGPMRVSYVQYVPNYVETYALMLRHYRWWSVNIYRDIVKIGPLSVTWYRWIDDRIRVSATWFGCSERILFGGPLAFRSKNADTAEHTHE